MSFYTKSTLSTLVVNAYILLVKPTVQATFSVPSVFPLFSVFYRFLCILIIYSQCFSFLSFSADFSILSNTFTDYEIHICDDGSTDGTVAIAKEYVEKYPQISLWQNEKNQGYTKNFLQAMKRETTPYVMLCDQDDIWYPQKVEWAVEALEKEEKDKILLYYTACDYSTADGEVIRKSAQQKEHLEKAVAGLRLF